MYKRIQGKCRLYESDGTTFICDARYRITIRIDSSARQDNTGYLYGIDIATLPSLSGKEGILKLEDGQDLIFAGTGLDMMASRLDIRINSVIKV